MEPFLNLSEISDYVKIEHGNFKERYFGISEKLGAKKLGYSVVILEPGYKSCPFHNHRINEEMFLVLEGTGTLRFGDKQYRIGKDDLIACPPGGPEFAHQILNTGDTPLRYLCLSTTEPVEICEYPDSNKAMSMVGEQGNRSFRHIARLDENVDYFEGED